MAGRRFNFSIIADKAGKGSAFWAIAASVRLPLVRGRPRLQANHGGYNLG